MTLPLLLEGIRRARTRQLAGRVTRPVRRRRIPGAAEAPPLRALETAASLWRSAAFAPPDRAAGAAEGRLERFQEAYGENVLEAARAGEGDRARTLAESWIAANPPAPGDPWHPYPLSTRIGNWIAAATLEPSIASAPVRHSLWRQARYLARNVEDEILGNHVIRNARALALAGAAFGADALTRRAQRILARELPEQVLPDGGHYERSPAYHLLVLRDLLEIRAALGGSRLDEPVERMRRFAAGLMRPDGRPALFNDGGLDIAPDLELPAAPDGVAVFRETGYVVVRDGSLWLAFDCGPPCPPFLPPHAHADALSFQLWYEGRPVVVDPGTYTYEPGAERDWFRGTRGHSTVALDGKDQFRLWGAFRGSFFPEVELLGVTAEEIVAAVRWRQGPLHVRRIRWARGEIRVDDRIEGTGTHQVISTLPLAEEGVDVRFEGPLEVESGAASISERFGERRRAPVLRAHGRVELPAALGWTIRLAG